MPEVAAEPLAWPTPQGPGRVLAVVGAECTGKSTLCEALAQALGEASGLRCEVVPEYLREWCDAEGRTPRRDEQAGIAAEQARRIAEAATRCDVVLADTTPLMTAVYHHQVFQDATLDAAAQAWQRSCALTLLTALDLPWQADGIQRDGPQVREPVDRRLRQLLVGAGLPFVVVAGQGPHRVSAALDAATALWRRQAMPRNGLFTRLSEREARQPAWQWPCDSCDQPDCEHRLLRLAQTGGSLKRR